MVCIFLCRPTIHFLLTTQIKFLIVNVILNEPVRGILFSVLFTSISGLYSIVRGTGSVLKIMFLLGNSTNMNKGIRIATNEQNK